MKSTIDQLKVAGSRVEKIKSEYKYNLAFAEFLAINISQMNQEEMIANENFGRTMLMTIHCGNSALTIR